jgi:multiple sugar transport system substrate-binding protein
MYDHIESVFAPGEVEIVAKADHPTLNRTVAEMLDDGVRIDVLATHSKYAPSQTQWLRPLEGLVDVRDVGGLAKPAVELCRFENQLWCVPRLIDVRLLWSCADRIETPPSTWSELAAASAVFGFTGRESGAFGMFFELVVGMGGQLFTDDLQPTMNTSETVAALAFMAELASRAPIDMPTWHYDDVDRALLNGRIDAAAAWPGGWTAIQSSGLPLRPSLYPGGAARRVSYSGCHAWAIPQSCGDLPGAVALVQRLCAYEAQMIDATGGSMCAHTDALRNVEPVSETDRLRIELTSETIRDMMITYPPLPYFPPIESAGASAITAVLQGRLSPADAAVSIQRAALAARLQP